MTPISKELSEQIEQDSKRHAYCIENRNGTAYDNARHDFEAGATAYAHYKERWEQAKKALEDIASGTVLPWLIAQQILASWKEEGKDDITEICYECEEKPVYSDKLCKDCYYK